MSIRTDYRRALARCLSYAAECRLVGDRLAARMWLGHARNFNSLIRSLA